MSKLILLISLIFSFFTIQSHATTSEEKIKADCYKKTGSYGGSNPKSPYQLCLRANGVVRVERNVSGADDKSKTDARICDASNPICSRCIGLYGSGDAKSARTKITECVQREEKKQRQAQQPKPKPKPKEQTIDGGRLQEVKITAQAPCSKTNPRHCTTMTTCETNNGVWDGQACAAAPCPAGTTPDPRDSKYCTCDSESQPYSIERGTHQQCPAMCKTEDHKTYNLIVRGCVCVSGYVDRTGLGTCVSNAPPAPQVAACIQELQDKITECSTASSVATDKCDPNNKSSGGDTLDALQGLLQGAAVAGGAAGNCGQAAIAGSTGYYAIEELRENCDNEITSCKTSCSDATAFINANKDRVYQNCRAKAWDDHSCAAPWATPYSTSLTQEGFNTEWDGVNKSTFEQQIQQMQTSITEYNSRCEVGGTADTNKDKMTAFMDDMNSSYKSAKQCECALSSGGNCETQAGPAECAGNPTLPGCAQAGINCLSATDNSPMCVCFKNPNSDECKKTQQSNNNLKINSSDVSAFAGAGKGNGLSGLGGGVAGKTDSGLNVGDLSGLGTDGEAIVASGTTATDPGSPFGVAEGGGNAGGASSGGGANGVSGAEADGEEESTRNKLGGLFNVAKSALGNLFKGSKDYKGTYDPVTGKYINAVNTNGLDPKKWRPRGMVRGLAGETEIAGKFEDIWKVMNRQYKIQDQKDQFLFGEQK